MIVSDNVINEFKHLVIDRFLNYSEIIQVLDSVIEAHSARTVINPELQESLDEMTIDEMVPVEKDMHRNLAVAMKTIEYLLKQLKEK